jgi:hypothetical protein
MRHDMIIGEGIHESIGETASEIRSDTDMQVKVRSMAYSLVRTAGVRGKDEQGYE